MAYRRKQVSTVRPSTFESPFPLASPPPAATGESPVEEEVPTPSLATQAIRASAAHRDSSLSSAYGEQAAVPHHDSDRSSETRSYRPRETSAFEYTSMKNMNESKNGGFWGSLARKAKSLLDEDNNTPKQFEPMSGRDHLQPESTSTGLQYDNSYGTPKTDAPPFQKSLNFIGGTIKNAFEEGKTMVESKTNDIIQETRKLNIRRKNQNQNQNQNQFNKEEKWNQSYLPRTQTDYETQLKASRDVANAMAAKAKLLLRELKTVKADLAFAKERCAQLEDENKILRESHETDGGPEDDDLIRLQLETLLAEKSRLAHENSIYARENRFLREIVEYHQLTMQDVIYVDEGIEEVSEVYPTQVLPPVGPTTPRKVSTPQLSPSPSNKSSSVLVPESCPIVPVSPQTPL